MIEAIKNITSYLTLNKKALFFLLLIVFCLGYLFLKTFVYQPSFNNVSYTNTNFNVLSLSLPPKLNFCGEKIPSNDFEIKDDLDKEFFNNAYWKNNSQVLFNKAQRWFPYIEPILKSEGVPSDFKFLAVIESHLSNAVSPVGAAGFWQLVPGTAYSYGLEVNASVDERYHVEKATRVACAHIKDAYAVFKNWTLAAAAYNLGIGGIQRALKAQNTDNYYDLLLNKETGSFVYRILAYKTLFSNPAHFGIKNKKWKYLSKIPVKVFKVDSSISNLEHFAKHIKYSLITIRQFNPWLLKNQLNNASGKVYEIVVPKNVKTDYSAYLSDIGHGYSDWSVSEINKHSESIKTDTTLVLKKTINYVVKIEEPLKNLAEFFRVSEADIKKWNNLNPDVNKAVKGQTLVINYYGAR